MATDQQNNPPSVVGTLYNEHERTTRFQENLAKRPRDCDPNASFETKWAFTAAETKRADVEKKTSTHLASASMTLSFAMRDVKEEVTEIDSLLCGLNTREHELGNMTNSLENMCLTLVARSIDRKKRSSAPSPSNTAVNRDGGGESQQQPQEDIDMKTAAKDETTITSPTSAVSTADEISIVEHAPTTPGTTVIGQMPTTANPSSSSDNTTAATAQEIPARSPSNFDYSALSAYTPLHQRTPCKMDSTFTCPRTAPKSPSSRRSRSERRA